MSECKGAYAALDGCKLIVDRLFEQVTATNRIKEVMTYHSRVWVMDWPHEFVQTLELSKGSNLCLLEIFRAH